MREVRVYSQLPPHNRLLKMIDYSDDVFDAYIIFEHMKHGSLEAYLDSNAIITYAQRLKWSIQAAEGITFLHQFGIIHGDIKPQNMLLDDKLCLRIIDFSGSSVDGLPPLGLESTRYFLPRSMESAMPCTITTDLFALGSSLYHIMRGSPPYANIDDEEVQQLYQQQSFPDLVDVPCGEVISKCWLGNFVSAHAVMAALRSESWHTSTYLSSLRCLLSRFLHTMQSWYHGVICALRAQFSWVESVGGR